MQHLINIHFTSKTLGRALLGSSSSSSSSQATLVGGNGHQHARAGAQAQDLTDNSVGAQAKELTAHSKQAQAGAQPAAQPQPHAYLQPLSVGTRAAMLYFVFNRSVVAVIVAHDLQRGEFVAQVRPWMLQVVYRTRVHACSGFFSACCSCTHSVVLMRGSIAEVDRNVVYACQVSERTGNMSCSCRIMVC